MFLHARDISPGSQINTQVCVAGAGAAGITLALELAQAGIDVVLLDGEDQPQSGDFDPNGYSSMYEGEQGDFLSAATRHYPLPDDPDGPSWMALTRKRSLGGSTNGWGGTCIPLFPVDFNPPKLPGIPWPFTRGEIEPYYVRALPILHLGKMEYFDIGHWTGRGYADPFAGDPNLRTVVAQRSERQYWKFQHVFSSQLNDSRIQIIRGGNLAGMNVSNGRVRSVQVAASENKSHFTVTCKQAVVAAGGVENVRLLFNADPETFPNGLGNNSAGMLGRHFCVHPLITGAAYVLGERVSLGGIFKASPPNQQPNNVSIEPWMSVTGNAMKDLCIANFRVFLARAGGGIAVNLNWQQVSNPYSAITPVSRTDKLGQRCVKVDWRLSRQDFKTASVALDLIQQWFRVRDKGWILMQRFDAAQGDCKSDGKDWHAHEGYGSPGVWAAEHHLGATRMAADSREGVVDANCRVHTVENLFVAGSSVFPQAGFSNPTFTIVALALRLADHLKTLI